MIGVPDADWGESVVTIYSRRGSQSVDTVELDRLCLEHIARFKRPKQNLSKNAAGKVLKTRLRDLMASVSILQRGAS